MEYRMPELLWDRSPKKIMLLVLGAKGIRPTSKNGYANSFCRITYNGTSFKTKTGKKTLEPVFNEFFLFDSTGDVAGAVVIKMYDAVKKHFLGEVKIENLGHLKTETVYTFRLKLFGDSQGVLSFRLLISDNMERKPATEKLQQPQNFYPLLKDEFRSGDLILFNGFGALDSCVKMIEGIPYSRLGMVLKLPNQYTDKKEPYLLEITRNVDRFLDAFREEKRMGVNLFRLEERLHHYHGVSIHWCRLKEPISPNSLQSLKRYVLNHHRSDYHSLTTSLTSSHPLAVSWLGDTFKIGRQPPEVLDYYSCHFIAQALSAAGLTVEQEPKHTITSISSLSCYSEPFPIRLSSEEPVPLWARKKLDEKQRKLGVILKAPEGEKGEEEDDSTSAKVPDFFLFHRYVTELSQSGSSIFFFFFLFFLFPLDLFSFFTENIFPQAPKKKERRGTKDKKRSKDGEERSKGKKKGASPSPSSSSPSPPRTRASPSPPVRSPSPFSALAPPSPSRSRSRSVASSPKSQKSTSPSPASVTPPPSPSPSTSSRWCRARSSSQSTPFARSPSPLSRSSPCSSPSSSPNPSPPSSPFSSSPRCSSEPQNSPPKPPQHLPPPPPEED